MSFAKPNLLSLSCATLLLFVASLLVSPRSVQGERREQTGEQAFRKQCASCHGVKGEGAKGYPKPLTGTQSVGALAKFIAKTMPPGPKKCSAEDARKVAAYLYDAFYSPIAQERNRPARIELSRLTVRQYRNALADLAGGFRRAAPMDERRGLRGEYFKTQYANNRQKAAERIDPEIKFDFGTNPAVPEQPNPRKFAMLWSGSVLAPDTGEYEFILKTEHAVSLWVNDMRRPLIDAMVKSGKDNEYRGVIYLLGGRAYPLRLEFSKSNQGVNDDEKDKKRPVSRAYLALEWRVPKRIAETIPQRNLIPSEAPEGFAVSTPFPPDDRSIGYERGNSISKAWEDATTEGAIETANYVMKHLAELSGVPDNDKDRANRLKEFCKKFAERAFRRPLSKDAEAIYAVRPFQNAPDVETGVKRSLLLTLKSPRFLYRELGTGKPDPYNVASRLSFGLWDSSPDEELLKAAERGELNTREQALKQAERMANDPRAWFKLREFFLQWFKVDQFPELAKEAKVYPDFSAEAQSDLRTSFEIFLESVIRSEKSDYRELLLTDKVHLNGRLAKLYGVNLPPDAPFQQVALDPEERSGALTHPYLMASFAYFKASSPIHRGVLLARNLLGRTLQPPPQAVAPVAADLHPNLTTRQRVTLQTRPAVCMGCHGMINPLGFTLEKFDAIGRVRAQENAQAVDSSGFYLARNGQTAKFKGAKDLGQFIANSGEAHAAFVEKLFQYLTKQPIRAFGTQALPNLQRAFEAGECNIRKAAIEMMVASASYAVK